MLNAPDYLSPSSIATFHQCPYKYKLSRIDGIKEPPTEHTLLGNYVHSVLENFYRLEQNERTVPAIKEIFRSVWEDYVDDVKIVYKREPKNVHLLRLRAWYCIENLMKMEDVSSVQFDGIETELDALVDGVKIKGFVDRWNKKDDDSIVISDYKTGKVPAKRWQDDKFDQLLIYAVVLSELLDKNIASLELLYVAHGEKLTKTPTIQDIERTKSTIVETRRQIDERCESGIFETKRSKLCSYCYFKTVCPEWSK